MMRLAKEADGKHNDVVDLTVARSTGHDFDDLPIDEFEEPTRVFGAVHEFLKIAQRKFFLSSLHRELSV